MVDTIEQNERDKTKISRRRKISKDFYIAWTLGKFTKQSEVEHLFDAHYRASRPRRRIIRVYGGVRGRGRWVTSPGAFTLLFFALPLPRLFTLFFLPDGVCLSLSFLLPILPSLFFLAVSKSFPLDAFVYQLPAKVTEQQLYELRSRRYFAFSVYYYHSHRFILCRSSLKLEEVMVMCTLQECRNHFAEYFA